MLTPGGRMQRLLRLLVLWHVMPGALMSVGNNGVELGGERAVFVSKVTKLVRRGPRVFAVLDEDKYLPLSHPLECPRPPGLRLEEGQWLKVEARRNMDASKNPWTCTRVFSVVPPPSLSPQYVSQPWQRMEDPPGMMRPSAEPVQHTFQHQGHAFQSDVGNINAGWNEQQPSPMMQQGGGGQGFSVQGQVNQYATHGNYAPRADMSSFKTSPGKRPAPSLNPGFHGGMRTSMGLRGSLQFGDGSMQPIKMHRGRSWDAGGIRLQTEDTLNETLRSCRRYMDVVRSLEEYFASSSVNDLSSTMASHIIYKMSCLITADQSAADKHINHPNSQALIGSLLQRLRSDTLTLSCSNISTVLWALGKVWLNRLKKVAHDLQESMKKAMEALATEVVARDFNTFSSQQLTMAIFGIAKSGLSSPRFASIFDKCEKAICEGGLANYTNQNLANTAWSFAFYGHHSNAVMMRVDDELSRRNISALKPAELSMTLWACARYQHPSEWIYTRFSSEIQQRGFSNCSTQELANLCWALTETSDEYGDLIYEVAAAVSSRPVNAKNAKDMRNILCCIAKSRVPDCGLASEVARELEARGGFTSVRAWILIFWSFSHVAFIPSSVLQQSFVAKVQGEAISGSTNFLCKALLSFVKLPLNQPTGSERILEQLNSSLLNETEASSSPMLFCSSRNAPTLEDLTELLWCCAFLRRLHLAPMVMQQLMRLMTVKTFRGMSSRHLLMLVWSTGVMQEEGFELEALGENVSSVLDEQKLLLGEKILSLTSRESLLRLLAVLLPCTEQSRSAMLLEHPAISGLWSFLTEAWAEDEDKLKRLQSLLGYA